MHMYIHIYTYIYMYILNTARYNAHILIDNHYQCERVALHKLARLVVQRHLHSSSGGTGDRNMVTNRRNTTCDSMYMFTFEEIGRAHV